MVLVPQTLADLGVELGVEAAEQRPAEFIPRRMHLLGDEGLQVGGCCFNQVLFQREKRGFLRSPLAACLLPPTNGTSTPLPPSVSHSPATRPKLSSAPPTILAQSPP